MYLVASGIALFFPHHTHAWPVLVAAHIGGVLLVLRPATLGRMSGRMGAAAPAVTGFIADWYPLLLVPALYTELAALNLTVWNGRYFDPLILAAERALFGVQPSRALAASAPYPALSEALHASYLSYYLIIYVPPLVLWLRGRRDAFAKAVFTLMLAFFAHYLFFIYFPVQGPRYLFPAPGGAIARGHAYALAHRLLEAGSSRGAAFPSSHVGVSVAQCVNVVRYIPWLAPVAVLLTIGLGVGAVYGGFHYATDAMAGLGLGLLSALVAPGLYRRMGGR